MTYKVQIDDLVRDATPAEVAQIEARIAQEQARIEAQTARAVARQALLTRLGITADEADLLFG